MKACGTIPKVIDVLDTRPWRRPPSRADPPLVKSFQDEEGTS